MRPTEEISLAPQDISSAWRGIAAWTPFEGLWQPWRVDPDLVALAQSAELRNRAQIANGGRFTARTDAAAVVLDVLGDPERAGVLEVVVDGATVAVEPVSAQARTIRVDLPGGDKDLELWLPHAARIAVGPVRLVGATTVTPMPHPGRRWTTYGSSITQCNEALTPTTTWPALVTRRNGWDLTALGMAGQCQLDACMAAAIVSARPDLVSLCLGINVYGGATFDRRSLPSAVTGFIGAVRAGLPATPIVIISPIASPNREGLRNSAGLTLCEVREIVAAATTLLQARGDRRLLLVDGRELIAANQAELLGDGLHPDPLGYRRLAERLGPILQQAADLSSG